MALLPLHNKLHADLTFTPSEDFSFAAESTASPVLYHEMNRASAVYPLVFMKGKDVPQAVLGLYGHNAFVQKNGTWNAPYIPLFYTNYPFRLARTAMKDGVLREVVGIETDAPHFASPDGTPLYTKDGKQSEMLKKISDAFGAQSKILSTTRALTQQILDAGVIEDKILTLEVDGKKISVQGFCFANQEKVNDLPKETQLSWSVNGVYGLLKAHWKSLKNFDVLMKDVMAQSSTIHK